MRTSLLLDRLELVLRQIKEVEAARDAVLKKPASADEAERMIRSLVDMRAIGSELATLLPRAYPGSSTHLRFRHPSGISTLRQRFAFARLSGSYLTGSRPAFCCNAHHNRF